MEFRIQRIEYKEENNIDLPNAYQKQNKNDHEKNQWYVDIHTIDDLMNIIDQVKCHVIVYKEDFLYNEPMIKIYDDYNE